MKKILSIILITINLLTITAFADTPLLNEIQKKDLYELGIMVGDQSGNLRLEDTITRAEVVKMICVAGELTPKTSEGVVDMFPDIPENHWAYNYIYIAKNNGIIVGDEKGYFNPENKVTNEEVIKMIICLLGYDIMADMKGGYPSGYTSRATKLGLTTDMQLDINTPAIRNNVAIMIYRALDIPLLLQKSEGNDEEGSAIYVIADGLNGMPYITLRGTRGLQLQWDTSLTNIDRLAQAFASQYPYKEGDTEKSFELYPDVVYSSGMEKTANGIEYECPAIYDDRHAQELVKAIETHNISNINDIPLINYNYAIFNNQVLVPLKLFEIVNCNTEFNKDTYVATISKDNTTLEVIPNIIGMRKNKAEGYWVPLEICARFIGSDLYVPLNAVANEFNLKVTLNATNQTLTIK